MPGLINVFTTGEFVIESRDGYQSVRTNCKQKFQSYDGAHRLQPAIEFINEIGIVLSVSIAVPQVDVLVVEKTRRLLWRSSGI